MLEVVFLEEALGGRGKKKSLALADLSIYPTLIHTSYLWLLL